MMTKQLQLNQNGQLRHFLTIEGLSRDILLKILDMADSFVSDTDQTIKKVPLLQGRTLVNLFFEPSTRTRTSFELAAKRLSADLLNISTTSSATTKGENLLDTVRNIEAMQVDMFILRHSVCGAADYIASKVAPRVAVINAGDGAHAHPTQAMLDMYTIRHHKKNFHELEVAIVGDIAHSRVARSQIHALSILGVPKIRVVAPRTLLPRDIESLGVRVYSDINQGLQGVDVVIMLRLQQERMTSALLPSSNEFYNTYGLTKSRLASAKADALVMHPGPINRGVEISSDVADGKHSVVLQQVNYGVAVRMAIMAMVLGHQSAI